MKVYIASIVGAGEFEFYGSMVFRSVEEAKREAVQALREYSSKARETSEVELHWTFTKDEEVWRGWGVQAYAGGYYIIIREGELL